MGVVRLSEGIFFELLFIASILVCNVIGLISAMIPLIKPELAVSLVFKFGPIFDVEVSEGEIC